MNAELATWDMLPEIGVHAEIYSPLQEDVEGKVDSRGLVRRPTFWYEQDYSFRIVPAAGPDGVPGTRRKSNEDIGAFEGVREFESRQFAEETAKKNPASGNISDRYACIEGVSLVKSPTSGWRKIRTNYSELWGLLGVTDATLTRHRQSLEILLSILAKCFEIVIEEKNWRESCQMWLLLYKLRGEMTDKVGFDILDSILNLHENDRGGCEFIRSTLGMSIQLEDIRGGCPAGLMKLMKELTTRLRNVYYKKVAQIQEQISHIDRIRDYKEKIETRITAAVVTITIAFANLAGNLMYTYIMRSEPVSDEWVAE